MSYGTKIILLAAFLLLSCSKEEEIYRNGESEPMEYAPSEELVFTAGQDSPVIDDCTRSYLEEMKVTFSAGDSVSLLSTKNTNVILSTTTSGTKVNLSGPGTKDGQYYAVYPYTAGAELNGSTITGFSIPAEQSATAGTYDTKASLTFAASTNTSLQFHNLCALLKFTANAAGEQPAIDHVTVSFTGTCSAAGNVTIQNIDGTASITSTSAASGMVTLKGSISYGNTYYIAIAPNNYSSVSLFVFGSGGNLLFSKSVSKSRTFTAGKIYNLGSISVIGHGVTEGHPWIQLKKDGPKWAEFNLGSTITGYSQAAGDNTKAWDAAGSVWTNANCGNFYVYDVDAVSKEWKGWSMPSASDIQNDLCGSSCTNYDWVWCDGTSTQYVPGCTLPGYKISGKGDYAANSIFLPAAGYVNSKSEHKVNGTEGRYLYNHYGYNYHLKFSKSSIYPNQAITTGNKFSIRPVVAK